MSLFGDKKSKGSNPAISVHEVIPPPPKPIGSGNISNNFPRKIPPAPKPPKHEIFAPPKKILLPDVPKHDKFVIPDLEIPSHIENKPAQEIVINPIQKPKIREPVIDIEEPIAYPQSKIHEQQFKERNYGYMSLWQFNQVKDDLNSTRDTLKDCEDIAEKLNVLKNKEDNAYTSWKGSLEIIERKLSYIEGTLFK